jgi:cell volume regulation protein A
MIGILDYATVEGSSRWEIAEEFALQMAVGLVVGVVAGRSLIPLMQRVSLPREGLYSIRVLAAAAVVYGVASVLHGSGFLAVFVLGLLIGDVAAPYKTEIERFHTALASLAEIAVFVALGLTIIGPSKLWDDLLTGVVLALVLALVARPVAVGLLLLPARLRWGEKLFIVWGGLKGAVPILLAAFAIIANVPDALSIYNIVFVVVTFSVLVQGSTIPLVARRLGVPMRAVEPEPWDVSIRLREPGNVQHYVVGPGSRVVGSAIRDLPLGERAWISFVVQDGQARQARGSHVLQVGDGVHVIGEPEDARVLQRLFEGPLSEPPE